MLSPTTHCFQLSAQRQLPTCLILLFTIVLLKSSIIPVVAQQTTPSGNLIDGFPVVLDNEVLFKVREGVPSIASAEERAQIISQRLANIASDPSVSPDTIQSDEQGDATVVRAGKTVLFTVSNNDAAAYNQSRQAFAEDAAKIIRTAVAEYRDERSVQKLILGITFTLLSTFALLLFLKLQQRLFAKGLARIKAARADDRLALRIQSFQLLSSSATSYLLTGFVKLVKLALILGAFYLYSAFVLKQFPATRPLGEQIFSRIAQQINEFSEGFAQYLPNLIALGIVAFLTYYTIDFAKLVIGELGRDDAYSWFYPEWTQPTNRLATFFILVIALVIAGPYLPGYGSSAFQGISIFLGALITLGSSSAVANVFAGIILIYTRAFQIGDIIRIGDTLGEVTEKSLFVTRLLSWKQEIITIPNLSVLNSNVVNYTAISRESGGYLLLYTTITLGYDVPWQKVYEVMIKAAEATSHIVSEPRPFVLQTSLNDYHISYELNAYTNRPELMPFIHSELHQNLQDYCNQAGIEILSPAYWAIRDGNHSTMPADYLPADYVTPPFQIRNQDARSQS